jgi:hypothetical protein
MSRRRGPSRAGPGLERRFLNGAASGAPGSSCGLAVVRCADAAQTCGDPDPAHPPPCGCRIVGVSGIGASRSCRPDLWRRPACPGSGRQPRSLQPPTPRTLIQKRSLRPVCRRCRGPLTRKVELHSCLLACGLPLQICENLVLPTSEGSKNVGGIGASSKFYEESPGGRSAQGPLVICSSRTR